MIKFLKLENNREIYLNVFDKLHFELREDGKVISKIIELSLPQDTKIYLK